MAIIYTKKLENKTGSPIVLSDLGNLNVPALTIVNLSYDDWVLAAQSNELNVKILAGDIVVHNADGVLPDTSTMQQWIGFFPINDGRYYTETETDDLLDDKSDVGHTHDHSALVDDEPEKHRLIDDAGVPSTTTLYSSDKIDYLINEVIQKIYRIKTVIAYVDPTVAPPTEVTGDRYILNYTTGTVHANWDGAAKGNVVEFNGTAWVATVQKEGMIAYVDSVNKDILFVDDGSPAWEYRDVAITAHNDLSGIQGGSATERYHLTLAQHTDLIAKMHDRSHAIDSTSDHTGLTSYTLGNFWASNSSGMPVDSGYDATDFAAAGHNHAHNDLTGLQGGTTGEYNHLTNSQLAGLHARSHAMTSTSDHTSGNWKVFYSNGSGQVIELTLGAANTVLTSNGATSAPTFDSPVSTTKGWHEWMFYKSSGLLVSQYAKFYEVASNTRPATSGKAGEIKRIALSVTSAVSADTVVALEKYTSGSWTELCTITIIASGSPVTAYADYTTKTFVGGDLFRVKNKSGVTLDQPAITVTYIDI